MTTLKSLLLTSVVVSGAALSSAPAIAKKSTDGCVTDNGNHVLTCKCNCDSLKTACDNGGASWEDTPTGGKCTVGGKSNKAIMRVFNLKIKAKPQSVIIMKKQNLKISK